MSDFQVTRLQNGDFQVDPIRPPDPPFGARFRVADFDLGHAQGLGVQLANGKRYAVRVRREFHPMIAAGSLRMLANWIEANA